MDRDGPSAADSAAMLAILRAVIDLLVETQTDLIELHVVVDLREVAPCDDDHYRACPLARYVQRTVASTVPVDQTVDVHQLTR